MSEPDVPALCLLDELSANRFRAVDGLCAHSRASPLVYDSRGVTSKRFYLQCVLARASIFKTGQKRFRSDLVQAYYKWLLRARGAIPGQAGAQ
eukprot:9103250-Pyramimonas_sp.AAC.1